MRVQIVKIIIELLHISAENDELKQKESILVEAMMYIV